MPSQTKKSPNRGAITFRLMPREEYEDGTLEDIETWIKREAARLLGDDDVAADFVREIAEINDQKTAAGRLYGSMHSAELKQLAKLRRRRDAARKRTQVIWVAAVKEAKRPRAEAKTAHGKKVRDLKTHKAKYNTYCNRFFNAVSKRIFQNMRSICGIQHTWSDPKVKRDIQSSEINKGCLPKSRVETKLKQNPVSIGYFS
jgi:hypothetical protein